VASRTRKKTIGMRMYCLKDTLECLDRFCPGVTLGEEASLRDDWGFCSLGEG
jgi:hypothetical protein